MHTRTIDIDFEVHKRIELERQSFTETPNDVLCRLLGIALSEPVAVTVPQVGEGRPWVGKGKSTGLTLPHGSELQMDYNDQRFTGRVDNGSLVFERRRFASPSGAADSLCRTRDGRKTSLNGKELISVRLPGETKWVLLKTYERLMQRKAA